MERWKEIEGLDGYYQVSDHGRVRSVTRHITHTNGKSYIKEGAIMSFNPNSPQLYKYATFSVNQKRVYESVHRLVAKAFVPNPNNFNVVNHLDSDRHNNHFTNLEWCTRSRNYHHAVETGVGYRGKPKLTESDVIEIHALLKQGIYHHIIGDRYGVTAGTISGISKCKTWKHLNLERVAPIKSPEGSRLPKEVIDQIVYARNVAIKSIRSIAKEMNLSMGTIRRLGDLFASDNPTGVLKNFQTT